MRNAQAVARARSDGPRRAARERATKAPPSRAGKRLVSAFVAPEVLKQFRLTVLENDSTIQDVVRPVLETASCGVQAAKGRSAASG
jgi:hypothetical protein